MSEKVLFVDDDELILSGFRRHLVGQYEVYTALGPERGLAELVENGPFAVVVSDLRMPVMDGIAFLSKVQDRCVDTVRVMLTGNADIEAAISAVNENNIFRFLTKPVDHDTLARALDASLQQYRLLTAERELLQNTLRGSIKVLVDVLSLTNPAAFSQASRIKGYVRHIATALGIPNAWQFELAALLSQIGCVALPRDILEAASKGTQLEPRDAELLASHPAIARDLLANIPRMESISSMIARQQEAFVDSPRFADQRHADPTSMGAQMLKISLDLDNLVQRGETLESAVAELLNHPDLYDPSMVSVLDNLGTCAEKMVPRALRLWEIKVGMVLGQNVKARGGTLLLAKGGEMTPAALQRLRCWAQRGDVEEPIRVLVPVTGMN